MKTDNVIWYLKEYWCRWTHLNFWVTVIKPNKEFDEKIRDAIQNNMLSLHPLNKPYSKVYTLKHKEEDWLVWVANYGYSSGEFMTDNYDRTGIFCGFRVQRELRDYLNKLRLERDGS